MPDLQISEISETPNIQVAATAEGAITAAQDETALVIRFAVREFKTEHIPSYAITHPETGEVVGNRTIPNGYCEEPLELGEEAAQALADRLTSELGAKWGIEAAPLPCANCGRKIWADDGDFCYPQNRERTKWRAGCNEHDFGCGHEVEASTYDEVMALWNTPKPGGPKFVRKVILRG